MRCYNFNFTFLDFRNRITQVFSTYSEWEKLNNNLFLHFFSDFILLSARMVHQTLKKFTPGQKHIYCRVRNPGFHFRISLALAPSQTSKDVRFFYIRVCINIYFSAGVFLTWPQKTLVIYPPSGLVNKVEVMWILAGNFFFVIFIFITALKDTFATLQQL